MDEKFGLFVKHHKIHLIIFALGIILFGSFVYKQATSPIVLVSGIVLNADGANKDTAAEQLTTDFIQSYHYESKDGQFILNDDLTCKPGSKEDADATIECVKEIMTGRESELLDFVVGPSSVMTDLVYNTTTSTETVFTDLRSVMTKEELALYEPYFLYIDQDVVNQLDEAYESKKDTSSIELPDCRNPEAMKSPIPVMIDLSTCEKLADFYAENSESLIFAIVDGTPSREKVVNFLEYLMQKED